jgi:hypothetical protein
MTAGNGPIEPPADMRAAAKQLRSLFISLTNEDFTEQQALVIIGQILAAGDKK